MYQNEIKIVLDKIIALLTFLIVSPVFILIILILFLLQKKVFFIQTRVGKNQKRFSIYKFQTMSEERDVDGKLLSDEARITAFGKFLRATSLDELPQLFNILKGDISIVGPRPIVEKETQIYGDDVEKLLSVKPGLTGYWQAYARNNATYESGERQKMEMYYVEHNSLWLDIKILFKTVISVIKKEGAQ